MTIRVEREALLRVISRAPPSTITNSFKGPLIERRQQQPEEDEFVIVEFPDAKEHAFFFDDLIPDSKDDDDQASFCTLSTDSVTTSSTSTLDDSHERRVTFAPELVTEVWTREKTPPEDIPRLFYSSNETQTVSRCRCFARCRVVVFLRASTMCSAIRVSVFTNFYIISLTLCFVFASFFLCLPAVPSRVSF